MRLRLTKIDDYQFLTCVKHGLWGSKSARFRTWQEGDLLAFIVDKSLAGLAQVSGPPFESQDMVWNNGVFPHRISLKFTHILQPQDRPPILGEVRDALTQQWGPRYGWAILNQQVLESPLAESIVTAISSRPNALQDYLVNLADRMQESRLKRERDASRPRGRGRPPKTPIVQEESEPESTALEAAEDVSSHTRAQSELIALGRVTGCSVWLASNDRSRSYRGKNLADECIKQLPRMGLSDEAAKRISLIDVIWLQHNAPACAFEIETSTSVYSGLLRMSDLLAVVPALNIHLYVVAPHDRQDKVLTELARPTFRKIGLSEYCRYISCEDLSALVAKVKDFGGHIQPTILETVSVALQEEEDQDTP